MAEIAIEASEIVSRLEQVAEGANLNDAAFSSPTVFLGLEQRKNSEILDIIDGLISSDDESNTSPNLDDISKLVVVSHSIASYCGSLEKQKLKKLSTRLTTDTSRWISQMFGYVNQLLCVLEGFVKCELVVF